MVFRKRINWSNDSFTLFRQELTTHLGLAQLHQHHGQHTLFAQRSNSRLFSTAPWDKDTLPPGVLCSAVLSLEKPLLNGLWNGLCGTVHGIAGGRGGTTEGLFWCCDPELALSAPGGWSASIVCGYKIAARGKTNFQLQLFLDSNIFVDSKK